MAAAMGTAGTTPERPPSWHGCGARCSQPGPRPARRRMSFRPGRARQRAQCAAPTGRKRRRCHGPCGHPRIVSPPRGRIWAAGGRRGLVPALLLSCAHAAVLSAEPRGTGQCPSTVIAELSFLGVAVTTAWTCRGTAGDSPPGAKGHSRGTALVCREGKGGTEPSAPSATSDPGATPAPSARRRGRHRPPWVTRRRGDGRGGCPCGATVPAWLSPRT